MQRRRLVDRRQSLGRRIVRERRRRTVSVAVDRRSGIDRRTNMLRRSGDERGGGADSTAPPSELRTHRRFFPRHFERTPPGVFPGDGEQTVAARARDLERMLAQRRARAALRADAVARSPGEGRLRRVGDARYDGPQLGTKRENLQEGARDRDEAPIHFEHTLGGRGPHHAIPRAAAQVAAGANPRAGPLFSVRHGRPPGRMTNEAINPAGRPLSVSPGTWSGLSAGSQFRGSGGSPGAHLRSTLPSFCTPDSASHSRARVESTAMLRTTEPGVGIFTVSARSVAGSNATIWSVPDSSYQIRPSVPTAMPYGSLPLPPGLGKSRTCPVAGSSRPSLPRA